MKVLILSKAMVVGTYQRKAELLARAPDVELTVVVPPSWREPGVGEILLERLHTRGYRLIGQPIALNGHFHLYFWRALGDLLRQERPDIVHIDEESFNLATFQAMRLGVRLGARCLFFNWANVHRHLPPPFSWIERYNLAHAACAVAGNREAADILRRKGYRGPLHVLPQFGVDEETFHPTPRQRPPAERLTIGYAGRLVPQKGLLDLLEAVAGLPQTCLLLAGRGALESALAERSAQPDLRGRVGFLGQVPSAELPDFYRRLDVLVLPSRTTPNWKEQFGRVLIEAMACGVPVAGSDSGEIPRVIGDAGVVFPEGDSAALRRHLQRLQSDPAWREELGRRGRERVLALYTQERVARGYLDIYREMVGGEHPAGDRQVRPGQESA